MVMDWNKDEIANVDDLEYYIIEHVLKLHEYNQYSPSIRYNQQEDKLVMKFRYGRGIVPGKVWKKVTDYLKEDYEILEESNHYESNYDPGEPPEWVPTIVFKVKE